MVEQRTRVRNKMLVSFTHRVKTVSEIGMDSAEEFNEDVDIDDKSTDEGNEKPVKKRYKCTYEGCSAAFGKPSRLVQHERIHSGERPFKCEQCEQSYTRSFHLKRHVSTVHEQLAIEMFSCPKENCGKQFVSRQKMEIHHENAHSANSLKCPTCEKTFKKNQQLKIHQYQHTGILPYVCNYEGCGKRFLMPSRLKGHAKIHKGYLCTAEGCNQEFPMWSALRKHNAEAHAQKHVCTVCNSSFKTRGFLKSHMKMHQPTREVFHCTIESCSRQFYYQKNLQSHIDNYHNPGQFQCKEEGCGKIFIQKASLKSHVARHRLPTSGEKIRNAPTNRKVRSDKGQPKKAIAAILSGQPVTNSASKIIMRSLE